MTQPTNSPQTLAIEVQNVHKAFGPSVALRDVSFSLGWGRVLALFGHNGAGKSTLLRTLATLLRPDAGEVRLAGLDAWRSGNAVRASVGYVGHQPLLYEDLSARENLSFYARLYRLSDAGQRVERVIQQVGASSWAHRLVRTLSNGMQKRVAIARAILHQPPVLLLDEAETGLDASGLSLLEEVVRTVAGAGASVILTTHSLDRGLSLATDVAVLSRGRMALAGRADAITAGDVLAVYDREAPA